MSNLIVYKASAGSGKTFRLAAEYIAQLIKQPENYRHILAVTFTNKATAEMKGRILQELYAMSKGEDTSMSQEVTEKLSITKDKLQQNARRALSLILHDYSRFSVSTIDSFVQRVIQALLWEVGEQGGFDIELDTISVLEFAADSLLDSASQSDELMRWLTRMGESQMDEGGSWDVRRRLVELGKQLFSEKFRLMDNHEIEKFADKKLIEELKVSLNKLIKETVSNINQPSKVALAKLSNEGIDVESFLRGRTGVMGFFLKCAYFEETSKELPNTSLESAKKALSDPTGIDWVSKAIQKDKHLFSKIENAVKQYLHPTLNDLCIIINSSSARFLSARLILKNLENLALIGDLWLKVREISKDEGFLLLSDSGHLLREFVKETDAPFVYEKIGTRFNSFMIDEFQDTSVVQWHNFKPLINDSLSQECFSMVVGDVKQSIYRWRNGDWSILSEGIEKDFAHHGVLKETLNTNWRSLPTIVNFNNIFFEKAIEFAVESIHQTNTSANQAFVEQLCTQISSAYSDFKQELPEKMKNGKGYVEVSFFDKKINDDYIEILSKEFPNLINRLKENHSLGDLAVLVRSKKDGQQIANLLLEYNRVEEDRNKHISFVSQEGLLLKASSSVRLVIAALNLIQDPNNEIAQKVLSKEHLTFQGDSKSKYHKCFSSSFPQEETDWLRSLSTRPLQEIFEAIVNHFNLNLAQGELTHLSELHEHILTHSGRTGGDLNLFLSWWNQHSDSLSLSIPESTNAVTIITIHKAKGLQFPVVIVPFAGWPFRTSNNSPLLWVSSPVQPFNLLPRYPIYATIEAQTSLFAEEVLEEKMREVVDNLNLLYVAFTRSMKELYVFVPLKESDKNNASQTTNSTSRLLWRVLNSLQDLSIPEKHFTDSEKGTETFCFGEIHTKSVKEAEKHSGNVWLMDTYPSGESFKSIRIRSDAEEFFLPSCSEKAISAEYGMLMHELFSRIITFDDIVITVNQMIIEGKLSNDVKSLFIERIKILLNEQPFKDWFSGKWETKTESSILTPYLSTYRPDRVILMDDYTVVVDFKFGIKSSSHQIQVKGYMNLLKEMGLNAVKGYLWYVDENHLIEV